MYHRCNSSLQLYFVVLLSHYLVMIKGFNSWCFHSLYITLPLYMYRFCVVLTTGAISDSLVIFTLNCVHIIIILYMSIHNFSFNYEKSIRPIDPSLLPMHAVGTHGHSC